MAAPLLLPPEEQRLLTACLAQDRQAQVQLYHRYKTAMFSTALRILGHNRELAQDALQEAFVEVFQHLTDFRQQSTLGPGSRLSWCGGHCLFCGASSAWKSTTRTVTPNP